jgi:hypothetical protein
MDAQDSQRVELSVSDQAELGFLREWLSWTPGLDISQAAGEPGPGEQGALDVLMMLGSSGVLIAAIKTLPEFLRSRRTGLSVTMTVKGKPLTLDASNIDEVMPILERLLDD